MRRIRILPPAAGCRSAGGTEVGAEMACVGVAALHGDFGQREFAVFQELAGALQAQAPMQGLGCAAERFAATTVQVARRAARCIRDFGDAPPSVGAVLQATQEDLRGIVCVARLTRVTGCVRQGAGEQGEGGEAVGLRGRVTGELRRGPDALMLRQGGGDQWSTQALGQGAGAQEMQAEVLAPVVAGLGVQQLRRVEGAGAGSEGQGGVAAMGDVAAAV